MHRMSREARETARKCGDERRTAFSAYHVSAAPNGGRERATIEGVATIEACIERACDLKDSIVSATATQPASVCDTQTDILRTLHAKRSCASVRSEIGMTSDCSDGTAHSNRIVCVAITDGTEVLH